MKEIKKILTDLLFPPVCPVCGEAATGGKKICADCRKDFIFINDNFCKKCGRRLSVNETDGICGFCKKIRKSFVSARALMEYNDPAREAMSKLKNNSKKEYAEYFGEEASEILGGWVKDTGTQYLVPVPVHKIRLKKRGYNQAEEIAAVIGKKLKVPVVPSWLSRRKNTSAQKALNPSERLENIENAFAPGRDIRKGTTVMLIDDIYTTGATLEACTGTLLRAGVKEVYALCICIGEGVY